MMTINCVWHHELQKMIFTLMRAENGEMEATQKFHFYAQYNDDYDFVGKLKMIEIEYMWSVKMENGMGRHFVFIQYLSEFEYTRDVNWKWKLEFVELLYLSWFYTCHVMTYIPTTSHILSSLRFDFQ